MPFNEARKKTGNLATWANDYTNFLRAFTESIIASALPRDAAQHDIIEKIYSSVEQRLNADPDHYSFRYISLGVLLTRL